MPDRLSVAILGAGLIAGGYDENRSASDDGTYSHAGAYLKDGRFTLQTVCDLDLPRAEEFKKRWQVLSATGNLDEVLGARHDVVSLCTPDATHFALIRELIGRSCCRTILAEKPLALTLPETEEVARLSRDSGVNVVVNFQRHFDPCHEELRRTVAADPARLLSGSALYIKGLEHIGVTMIDTLLFLLGAPRQVYAFNRVFNRQVHDYSYEFILYYDGFTVTVKSADSEDSLYNYHVFEIDLLFKERRVTINDNSRQLVTRGLVDYAYSGVRVLDDRTPAQTATGYGSSMLGVADYVYRITTGAAPHTVNTPQASCLNKLIVDTIISSYEKDSKLIIGASSWKK